MILKPASVPVPVTELLQKTGSELEVPPLSSLQFSPGTEFGFEVLTVHDSTIPLKAGEKITVYAPAALLVTDDTPVLFAKVHGLDEHTAVIFTVAMRRIPPPWFTTEPT